MPQVQAFNYSMGIQSGNILGTGVAIYRMSDAPFRADYY
jgi:hypothetical protein